MGMPVVTVASGGMPVIDVSATTKKGLPVSEAANGFGRAVTKVAIGGIPVVYVTAPLMSDDGQAD
jgi:phosphoglycerate dehydrogenase-like enzyme